ncbi:hypothetical protein V1477_000040, partial [Vespula maculifrons]
YKASNLPLLVSQIEEIRGEEKLLGTSGIAQPVNDLHTTRKTSTRGQPLAAAPLTDSFYKQAVPISSELMRNVEFRSIVINRIGTINNDSPRAALNVPESGDHRHC